MGSLGPATRVAVCAALLLAAVAYVVVEPWHGPIVLSLSAGHGIDSGDLPALVLIGLAIALLRGGRRPPRRAGGPERSAAAAVIALGGLLLLVGLVGKEGGGPLVPAGGGTLGGTIREAFATRAMPADRWSDVAVTYDGSRLRLYIDGDQVASRAATGTVQQPGTPLWIGGNQPYGEHFDGVIDEVRVYARALGVDELRRDMRRPIAPAPGLVAAYGFDAGSGATAADASGHGNTGAIHGARWTRGRFGDGLRFDGAGSVVRVPTSPSLDLTRAMTLSGWVRPSASQHGWRTVVQRQADAYLLTAGSDRQDRLGRLDDVRAALLVGAAAWLAWLVATGRAATPGGRRRAWWVALALFVAGALVDALLAPEGTFVAPALVALWLGATADHRSERLVLLSSGAALAVLTVASLAHAAGLDLAHDDGAVARAAAFGVLLVVAGAWRLERR